MVWLLWPARRCVAYSVGNRLNMNFTQQLTFISGLSIAPCKSLKVPMKKSSRSWASTECRNAFMGAMIIGEWYVATRLALSLDHVRSTGYKAMLALERDGLVERKGKNNKTLWRRRVVTP